jgi:hypothetical protein
MMGSSRAAREADSGRSAHPEAPSGAGCGRGLWLVALAILAVGALASPVQLVCRRAETGGPAECARNLQFFGVMPLPGQRIEEVRSAHLEEWILVDDEGEQSSYFRIALDAAGGRIPLTHATYFLDRTRKTELVSQANSFLGGTAPGTMALRDGGVPSMQDLAVTVGVSLVPAALLAGLWQRIRSWRQREESTLPLLD